MMMPTDAYTDVVELCALLQCLGFSVKSLDTNDGNASQDSGARTVVINCQSSGLHVVLENASLSCSCPTSNNQNSGIWQVSGVTGGKQLDKEFGCSLLSSLPKGHRDRLTKELHEMIRCIKQHNDSELEPAKDKEHTPNRSASMIELKTPDKRNFRLKPDTPTRYRSLDTLTGAKKAEQPLPAPGLLQRAHLISESSVDDGKDKKQAMCRRQSTYTLSSTPGSMRRRNKTSSPIKASQSTILDSLMAAERAAEELRSKLALVIQEFVEDGKDDSSISSLALDVSKISVLKCAESTKAQFASSPNLSGTGIPKEDLSKIRIQRFDSASTSNLTSQSASKESKTSRLRRISPSFFKMRNENPATKTDKAKALDAKSKLNSLFKPKIVTPVRTQRASVEPSPNLSSSRKKYSHIKSTIPKPSKKE